MPAFGRTDFQDGDCTFQQALEAEEGSSSCTRENPEPDHKSALQVSEVPCPELLNHIDSRI